MFYKCLQAVSPKGFNKAKNRQNVGKQQPIKTGNRAVDEHSQPCTMSDETGERVEKFRQLKIKEYYDIIKLCQQNNVVLNQKLLERGMLHHNYTLVT